VWYQNICSALFGFVTKHACADERTDRRTDGPTDGQNYDSQDRASIAASRSKKLQKQNELLVLVCIV